MTISFRAAGKYIKKKIKKYLFRFQPGSHFFSQGGEDATLYGIFKQKIDRGEKGFYVDIGAYHPITHSNTYLFYLKGWRGINIDACPGSMVEFEKLRKRDINLEVGIRDFTGESSFYLLDKNSTMNSFSYKNLKHHGIEAGKGHQIEVKTFTLENLLDLHCHIFEEIDFLSIDVEGLEQEVLKSNNWKKYKPKVILLEMICTDISDVEKHEITNYLNNKGYIVVAKNVILKNLASVFFVLSDFDY